VIRIPTGITNSGNLVLEEKEIIVSIITYCVHKC